MQCAVLKNRLMAPKVGRRILWLSKQLKCAYECSGDI